MFALPLDSRLIFSRSLDLTVEAALLHLLCWMDLGFKGIPLFQKEVIVFRKCL